MNTKCLFRVLVLVLLAQPCQDVIAQEKRESPLREKNVPATWKPDEMNEEMPYRWEAGSSHVLVWEVIDDGERVAERCLVIKQYKKPSKRGETCALGYLVRNPKDKTPAWHAKTLWITPDPDLKNPPAIWGYECYKALPSDKEIGRFLSDRGWESEVKPYEAYGLFGGVARTKKFDPKVTEGGVNPTAWKEVFGREPDPKLFLELVATEGEKKKYP